MVVGWALDGGTPAVVLSANESPTEVRDIGSGPRILRARESAGVLRSGNRANPLSLDTLPHMKRGRREYYRERPHTDTRPARVGQSIRESLTGGRRRHLQRLLVEGRERGGGGPQQIVLGRIVLSASWSVSEVIPPHRGFFDGFGPAFKLMSRISRVEHGLGQCSPNASLVTAVISSLRGVEKNTKRRVG